MNFRRLIRYLGPSNITRDTVLGTETDSRVLWSIATMYDALSQRVWEGVQARFPGLGPEDAIPVIGRDRRIIRGPNEPIATHVLRQIRWLDDHRQRGNAWSLLEQIRGYLSPHAVRVRTVDEHGNWYTIDRNGSRSRFKASSWNWDGSAIADARSRYWVIIYATTDSPQKPWARSSLWGDTGLTWGEKGRTWGSTATRDEIDGLRRIVKFWRPDGTRCVHILYVFDDAAFNPADTAPPLPDGTWGSWGTYSGTVKAQARNREAIYIRGSQGA